MSIIDKAVTIATLAHEGQTRKHKINGFTLPYITHTLEVSKMLWRLGFGDDITIASAILYDAVEDNLDKPEILDSIKHLGIQEITNTVMDLTIFTPGTKEEYLKRFGLPSIAPRSLVVKMSDRMCNVYDFMISDMGYAYKYFKKADVLEVGLKLKYKEIAKIWGNNALQNLENEWNYCKVSSRGN